jgi:putative transposase
LIVDARYERIREAGVIVSHAVPIAIDWDGRCQILGVELANRESRSSWSDFLRGLTARGLDGVELVVSDDHAAYRARCTGLKWMGCSYRKASLASNHQKLANSQH